MVALLLGSTLAVLALVYVIAPLVRAPGPSRASSTSARGVEVGPNAVDALREIEFDRETGKLSDDDYATLKAQYTPLALEELRRGDAVASASATPGVTADRAAVVESDAAEELIARARSRALSCSQCGPRPESDALFCSNCGRFLGSACLRCGAEVESSMARFCAGCGESLAA